MKNMFMRYAIVIRSISFTLYYSIVALSIVLTGMGSRARSNWVIRTWAQGLLTIVNLNYKIFNPHQVTFEPGKNYIVMCNHTSVYDIPLSIMALNCTVRMLAKKELSYIPIFGYAMTKNEFLFIDRKNREQAIKDLKLAAEKMKSGVVLWIAPEGTRSRDGQLLPFKKGGFMLALETGATIVPLGIRGALNIIEPKTFKVKAGQSAEVYLGKPIDTKNYSFDQRQQLMDDVKAALQDAAGL